MAGRTLVMNMSFGFFLGGHHYQAPIAHAALGDHMIGEMADIHTLAAQHAHLQAGLVIDIHL